MSFSARHAAKRGSNFAIAGALLTFCGGAYWYTMTKVRKDEMDAAIERREQQQEKQRGRWAWRGGRGERTMTVVLVSCSLTAMMNAL